ncbi:MAG: thioredoxin domain-containing protein [Myxococcota bacterium]
MAVREMSQGEVVAGRYEVTRVLSHGPTGVVYAAEHRRVGRPCALEVLAVDGQPVASPADFLESMCAVGRIGAHPHVAEFFDAGIIDGLATPYLAMERVEGEPIDAFLAVRRRAADGVAKLLMQVASALATAHAAGVVHGSLAPTDVLVHVDGPTAKVRGFGVARALGVASGFSAPEQLSRALRAEAGQRGHAVGDDVGAAADIFGFGLLAYVLFTGQRIEDYWGTEDVAEMNRRLVTTPRRPASQSAGVEALRLPPGFDAWFARTTAFDPSARPSSVEAAAAELGRISGVGGIGAELAVARSAPARTTVLGFAPPSPAPETLASPGAQSSPAVAAPAGPDGPAARPPMPVSPPVATAMPAGTAPSPGTAPMSSAPPPMPPGLTTPSGVPMPSGPAPFPGPPPPWGGHPLPPAPPSPPPRNHAAVVLIVAAVLGIVLVVGGGLAYSALQSTRTARSDDDDGRRRRSKPDARKKRTETTTTRTTLKRVPRSHATAPVPVGDDDPSWGDIAAPVTIVAFGDYQCPFCARAEGTLKKLRVKYGASDLRIVWKDFPLVFHKQARPAHDAARAVFIAAGPTAFWTFHDLAFANQRALEPANFEVWAKTAGVSASDMSRHAARAERAVEDNLTLGKSLGVRGTPVFFINGIFISGARPQSSFESEIDAQLAAAAALLKSGTSASEVYPTLTATNHAARGGPPPKPTSTKRPPDTQVWKVPVTAEDPSWGPSDALVTIVEFADFQCPFCKKVQSTLTTLKGSYPKDLRLVWKDRPLTFHKRALPAAQVGREAFVRKGNGAFWSLHDLLFANQGALEASDLIRYGGQVGLDAGAVRSAWASPRHQAFIDATGALADAVDAKGTPNFFINGRRLTGAQPLRRFTDLIDEERKKAEAMVARGTARADVYATIMKAATTSTATFEEKRVGVPPSDAPFRGNPKGKVVVHVFSDFQCPYCSRVNATLEALVAGDPEVKVVWRHHPLPFHKEAPLAHEASLEAYAQKGNDGFWAMHDLLFANRNALARPDLERYAADIGLDLVKFRAALDARKHRPRVEQDKADAARVGIRATPSFVANRWFSSGALPLAKFEGLVAHARAHP